MTAPLIRSAPVIVSESSAIARAIGRLEREHAVSLPWLDDRSRQIMLDATRDLPFRKAQPVVGEGERAVHQDFDICMPIPTVHPLHLLRRASEAALRDALVSFLPSVLPEPFALNDIVAQRYPPGSTGISPHRDHVRYVGLVAIVLLGGDGLFSVCEARSGAGDRPVPAAPGDLILMRAPGLFGRRDRPFHRLREIGVERTTVGLRQDSTRLPITGDPR